MKPEQMEMHSGLLVDPMNLEPDDVLLEDIIWQMGGQIRFGGVSRRTVLEHSMDVEIILDAKDASPEMRLVGLMHDAAEAYLGDIPRPIKRRLKAMDEAEKKAIKAIWKALDLPTIKKSDYKNVQWADNVALFVEAENFIPSGGHKYTCATPDLLDEAVVYSDILNMKPARYEDSAERFRGVYDHLVAKCRGDQKVPGYPEPVFPDSVPEPASKSEDEGRPQHGGGINKDSGKMRLELVTPYGVEAFARVATAAEALGKYPGRNWEKGLAFSRTIGSLKRHLLAIEKRDDIDPEFGLHHVDHLVWRAMTLAHYIANYEYYREFDDRAETPEQLAEKRRGVATAAVTIAAQVWSAGMDHLVDPVVGGDIDAARRRAAGGTHVPAEPEDTSPRAGCADEEAPED